MPRGRKIPQCLCTSCFSFKLLALIIQRRSGTLQYILTRQFRSRIPTVLKPWSEMWLTVLKVLHLLPVKSLLEKVKLWQVHVTRSQTRKLDMSIMSFQVTSFCCPTFNKLSHFTKRKWTSTCPKEPFRPFALEGVKRFDTFWQYTTWKWTVTSNIASFLTNWCLSSPSGYAILLSKVWEVCTVKMRKGASKFFTASNSRHWYVNHKFSSYAILLPSV